MSSVPPSASGHDENSIKELRRRASTSKQLMGLPVISIDDGESQGKIHDLVYDPKEGRLVGFVVQRGGGFLSRPDSFWLPSEALHALGEDAATVPSATSLQPLPGGHPPQAEAGAAGAGEPVLGKRLLTEGGKFLGNVDDVLIDRESRRLIAYEVSGGVWQDMMRGQTAVPVDQIISIGSAAVIVPDIVAAQVDETSGGIAAAAEAARERFAHARTEVAEAIEDKEADFARGKTAANALYDDDGSIIVLSGETITDAHIARAVAAGKMHALALTAGKAQAGEAAENVRERVAAATATVSEAAQERQAALLVGRTTGRAVLNDTGTVLVPADHVLTASDVAAVRAAGRLNDLTAAVGAGAWDAARERFTEATAPPPAPPAEPVPPTVVPAAPALRTATGTIADPAPTDTAPTVVIENPASVVVETPGVPSTPVSTPTALPEEKERT